MKILGNSEVKSLKNSSHEQDNARENLLFVCHLDSKGQRFHMNFRVFLFKWWIVSSICCFILIFFKNFIFKQFSFWFFYIGAVPLIFNLIIVILLCINTTNNESPGAIDNASGISCVLELLNYYTDLKNRLENYNLWFLFTGAEENGTMGIRHLIQKIKHLDQTKSFQLNFDTIGTNIDIITGEKGAFFFKNTKGFTATIHMVKKIRLARSDAYILKDNNITGFGVLDMESYKYVHSKDDTVDKVDCSLLENLLTHITVMLKLMDHTNL
ncbi:MAG: M20/M25/M40 family metallo-hydrolase [Promethearchaeota archaeon]